MPVSERLYCVYLHTNTTNNKKYIGITCRPPKVRWNNGKGYQANAHFWNAIKKDGWDNFTHEILAEGLSKQAACKLEQELIQYHKTTDANFGYNHSCGGEGGTKYLTLEEKTQARQQTIKKCYEKLKQEPVRYQSYLESNKAIHRTAYQDPEKGQAIRDRLNSYKQIYRQDPDYLAKDRAATRKTKEEVKLLRSQLLQLLETYPERFTIEDIQLITSRTGKSKNYSCNSKSKLQKILDNTQNNK